MKQSERYSGLQIALHWLVALLILAAFVLVWQFHATPLAPATFKLKLQLIAWHKWAGMTVLAFFVIRIVCRLRHGAPAVDPALPTWQRHLASSVHGLLYLLMLALPMVGWLMSSAKGYSVVWFNVLPLPDLISKNDLTAESLKHLHEFLANLLMALVALHVAGALKHHILDRDNTLARMVPWLARK